MNEVHLDTDVLIDLLEKGDPKKIISLMEKYDLKICAVVYFEFMTGAYKTDQGYLKNLLKKYFGVLPISIEAADCAAKIEADLMNRGDALDPRDAIIAATAIQRGAFLWARNKKHFERLKRYGLKLIELEIGQTTR